MSDSDSTNNNDNDLSSLPSTSGESSSLSDIFDQRIGHLLVESKKPETIADQIQVFKNGFIESYKIETDAVKDELDEIIQERILEEQDRYFPDGKLNVELAENTCAIGLMMDDIGDAAEIDMSMPGDTMPEKYAGVETVRDLKEKYDVIYDSEEKLQENLHKTLGKLSDAEEKNVQIKDELKGTKDLLQAFEDKDDNVVRNAYRRVLDLQKSKENALEAQVDALKEGEDACKDCQLLFESKATQEDIERLLDLEEKYEDAQVEIEELKKRPAGDSVDSAELEEAKRLAQEAKEALDKREEEYVTLLTERNECAGLADRFENERDSALEKLENTEKELEEARDIIAEYEAITSDDANLVKILPDDADPRLKELEEIINEKQRRIQFLERRLKNKDMPVNEAKLKESLLWNFANTWAGMYEFTKEQYRELHDYFTNNMLPNLDLYFKEDGVSVDEDRVDFAVKESVGLPADTSPWSIPSENSRLKKELEEAYAKIKELENKPVIPYDGEPDLKALEEAVDARINKAVEDKQKELDRAYDRIRELEQGSANIPDDLKELENAVDAKIKSETEHKDALIQKLTDRIDADDENRHAFIYIIDSSKISPKVKAKIYKAFIDQEEQRDNPDNYLAGVVCNNLAEIHGNIRGKYKLAKKYVKKAIRFGEADFAQVESHAAAGRLEKYNRNLEDCLYNLEELAA